MSDTTLDYTKLNSRIEELSDALRGQGQPGDIATLFEDESRLFLKQVIRLTPPKSKAQGEAAIARDLMKIFTPVNEEMLNIIGSEHGLSAIDVWLTTAGGEGKELDWRKIDPSGEGMKDFHNRNRDSRGRTYNLKRQKGDKWYAPYVVSFEDFAAYKAKMIARVGRRKAAWGKSFNALGGKLTNWIARHLAGAKGEYHNTHGNFGSVSIVMINRSVGISQDLHFVRGALRIRESAIKRRIKLVLSGYSKDVARGIKLQRRVYPTPESFQEAA